MRSYTNTLDNNNIRTVNEIRYTSDIWWRARAEHYPMNMHYKLAGFHGQKSRGNINVILWL